MSGIKTVNNIQRYNIAVSDDCLPVIYTHEKGDYCKFTDYLELINKERLKSEKYREAIKDIERMFDDPMYQEGSIGFEVWRICNNVLKEESEVSGGE